MSIYDSKNRFALPVAYYALNLTDFHMNMHTHNSCEIMYIVSGSCVIWADKKQLTLKECQFVFFDQKVPHRLQITPNAPCTILNLEFSCRPDGNGVDLNELTANSDNFSRFIENKEEYLLLQDNGKVGYALKDLIAELEDKERKDSYLLRILFLRMFIELTKASTADDYFMGILHLKKAQKYITDHLYEDLTVENIAAYVGINHSYLQTLFSQYFHCGIIAYANNLRMEHASFLLKNSSMNITDIAFHLGFNSRQHFGYTFEKHFKMRPQQYRKLKGQNITADTGMSQWHVDENGNYSAHILRGIQLNRND